MPSGSLSGFINRTSGAMISRLSLCLRSTLGIRRSTKVAMVLTFHRARRHTNPLNGTARLRGTGSGFTYNVGRIATAAFPFVVGHLVRSGADPLVVMSAVSLAPLVGVAFVLFGVTIETRSGGGS